MKRFAGIIILTVLAVMSRPVLAGDVEAGRAMAAVCVGCHGVDGKSSNNMWPNLAGQQMAYLVKQMKDFRDGMRNDPMMTPMARQLTNQDIENLAAYYNSL